jgi:transcriptional regulator with XRE-family HTH domain
MQTDVAFVMQLSDYANVSRWERGERIPDIEKLLMYELLFNVPISELFDRQKSEVAQAMAKRIGSLLSELKTPYPTSIVADRIAYLDSVLTRLTT